MHFQIDSHVSISHITAIYKYLHFFNGDVICNMLTGVLYYQANIFNNVGKLSDAQT
jgi:hypothetical protein